MRLFVRYFFADFYAKILVSYRNTFLGSSFTVSKWGQATGMGDVYVEQNGKFIKAPKELLEHCDFKMREVYLEEIG